MHTEPSVRPSWGGRPGRLPLASLAVLVMTGVAAALVVYPLFPGWYYAVTESLRASDRLPEWVGISSRALPQSSETVEGRRLIIPKIGVDSEIVEGESESALNRGTWRIPSTSTPDHGGNTVLSGHRFRFLPPNNTTFYLLDKVLVGDHLYVWWDGTLYTYRVGETRIVTPDAVEILDPSFEDTLTIFTCSPLLSTAKRLVVIAERVQNE